MLRVDFDGLRFFVSSILGVMCGGTANITGGEETCYCEGS